MNILIDLIPMQPYKDVIYHGGGEYIKAILYRMEERCEKFEHVYFVLDKKRQIPIGLENKIFEKIIYKDEEFLKKLEEYKISKFYVSTIGGYLGIKFPTTLEVLVTIHDLRALELTYDSTLKYYDNKGIIHSIIGNIYRFMSPFESLLNIVKKIRKNLYKKKFNNFFSHTNLKIITISNHSKYSFTSYLNIDCKKIEVFYSPLKPQVLPKEIKILENYFLIISANRLEKNSIRGILALDNFFSKDKNNYKAVILGGVSKKIKSKIKNPEKFIFKNYVSSEELEGLYKNSYAFLYPTISEGFGYPPIEAMKYGVPILASPITAVSEICGCAPLYFNPYSVEEIENRLHQISNIKEAEKRHKMSLNQYEIINKKQEEDLDKLIDLILE